MTIWDDSDHPHSIEVRRLRLVLNRIAALEPQLDTLPLDQAFRTLRQITKMAREALQG